MNILILTANGREHALAASYAKSKKVKKVIMIPGNGLTDFEQEKIKNYPDVSEMDFDAVVAVCKKETIDLVDVSQDEVIAKGFVDKLQKLGIRVFGPTQKAAQIEWDKKWARDFMVKYHLPIPHFKTFTNPKRAIEYVNKLPEQLLFVKASGLAFGKGAIRANNINEAIDAIEQMRTFGKTGETFLIEKGLIGEEFSLFAICDGVHYQIVSAAQDHKTVFNADQGPNTGGMGCVAPTNAVDKKIQKEAEEKIIKPLLAGMLKEKRAYIGILYLGGMLIKQRGLPAGRQVKIIEFNARWGDPEAEVILPGIQTDYISLVEYVLAKKLDKLKIATDKKIRISVAGCAMGYPNDYSRAKGKEIFGLLDAMKLKGITIFGAGIKRKDKRFFVNGGRIFHLVAAGDTIQTARRRAYEAMSLIHIQGNNLHYRTDIGWREAERRI